MKKLLKPDWQKIAENMDQSLSEDQTHLYWNDACKSWLQTLGDSLVGDYKIHETKDFFILSDESERYATLFSDFLERKLEQILTKLLGIASDAGYGKHVALVINNIDEYYRYIDLYYPDEGEFAPNSGVYLNEGYGHFAFPTQDLSIAEPIAVHELTHACLAHLPIPLWLNEGLAVTMEELLSASDNGFMIPSVINGHKSFWDDESIQRFWRGESFHEFGDGQRLSYSLAYILVRNISKDYNVFKDFVLNADQSDAGEASARDHLGISLAQLIEGLLGDGKWCPELMGHS